LTDAFCRCEGTLCVTAAILAFIPTIVYSHSFSAYGEIATLRNPSYAKASAGKARKINYKRRNGGKAQS
ncbi:hypothetical protein M0P98_05390, partial [bacterium]|nr:hypothetical protein [bacterium]